MATKATKKKTGGITPKEGMYFTANMGKKKIRGVVESVYKSIYSTSTEIILAGKDFSVDDSENDFPTYEDIIYEDADVTFEEALKKEGITNFTVCTDKRQKAVIDGDKSPIFGSWKVVNESGALVFGCGSFKIAVKNAKTFMEIFCDYGNPDAIDSYYKMDTWEDSDSEYLEDYYQVRKWLEENWTVAQKATFDDVLEEISKSGEQEINDLECSEMKALLAKF